MSDKLGERMKMYEHLHALRLLPGVPSVARLDGRAFHTLTKKLPRPFCQAFHDAMVEVTKELVRETCVHIGYTQSDEITLVFTDPMFDGRVQKLTSILAGIATAQFNKLFKDSPRPGVFDCRVFSVPSEDEAVNHLIWREQDAAKNSVNSVAQANFSHKSLLGLDQNQLQERLWQEKGINWSQDFEPWAKRGTYVGRVQTARAFTAEEVAKLPPKHAARLNPDLQVVRSEILRRPMPQMSKVINRNDVVFRGADPVTTGGGQP